VDGERGDVGGADDAADRERRPQLIAALLESISEQVWKAVKHDGVGKARALDESQLRAAIIRAVNRLIKYPEIIRGIFSDPNLAYIGACL